MVVVGVYKYNFIGETKHTMFLVYVQVTSESYFSYYYEDYEGDKIYNTISTNLTLEQFTEIKDRIFTKIDVTKAPDWLKEFSTYKIESYFEKMRS